MADTLHPCAEFPALVRPLVGMRVTLPWKGHGTAIFLELGALSSGPGDHAASGEINIGVEWSWRIELGARIVCGSSDSRIEMARGIEVLQGTVVRSLVIDGAIPELVVQFSGGHVLRTMSATAGEAAWSIRLAQDVHVYPGGGALAVGAGGLEPDDSWAPVHAHAEATTRRWGRPRREPQAGACKRCDSFIHLDAEASLMDYGVCTASDGPFDGRVVHVTSGCPCFRSDDA